MTWLRDNNTHINNTDAYEQGELACANGDDPEMNPYCQSDTQFDEWEGGYYAKADNLND